MTSVSTTRILNALPEFRVNILATLRLNNKIITENRSIMSLVKGAYLWVQN